MKNRFVPFTLVGLSLAVAPPALHAAYQPTWASVDQHNPAPEWFQDAKFGIYFHWGVFSVPAFENEWYPRDMYNTGDGAYPHHLATFGNPFSNSVVQFFPYDYFITGHTNLAGVFCQFAPVLKTNGGSLDPDAWAQLFVNAGAKFAGPVAEHHDGFSMWNSSVNEWNSVAQGPHLDLAAIWSAAFRAKGLKFLMSQHTAYNFNGYYQFVPAQTNASLQKLYGQLGTTAENQLWYNKLKEIIDGYHPDIIWQDGGLYAIGESYRLNFLSYYYNQALSSNQEVVATYKDGFRTNGEVYDFERGGPGDILYPSWLTDESISASSWCYTTGMGYYATNALLHELIDRVSKNGNLLLNIAPMADGTIPAKQQQILLGMGDWLGRFGESIYSNRAWVIYGEGPTSMGGGSFTGPAAGTSADIRFMRNKAANTLYAIALGWPGTQLNITSLNSMAFDVSTLTNVQLLGATAGSYIDLPLPTQDTTGLKVALPAKPYTAMAYVIKMRFSGPIPQYVPVYTFQWSAPVPITTADTTLNLPGTVVGAACFGATSSSITVTLTNGSNIVFYGNNSVATCTGNGSTTGAFTTNTTGNANFNAVLNGFEYDGGAHTLTLKNLTPGRLYSVQLFGLDNRSGVGSRSSSFQAPSNPNNSSATFVMSNNVYVVGTFVAAATNVVIQQNLPTSGNGNLNALVVRQLPGVGIIIMSQPQSFGAHAGDSGQLSAYATGGVPLTCQWQAGAVGSGVFTNFSGPGAFSLPAGLVSLNFPSLAAANTASYRLVLSNSSGSVTSSVATVTVRNILFTWQAPVPITTADATLNQPGTVVGAACFGATSSSLTVTLSTGTNIVFYGNNSVATCNGNGTTTGAFASHTTGNANFDTVLNGFKYDNGPHLITLLGLTVGRLYSVQLFGLDNRTGGGESSRPFNYQDPLDSADISQTALMGDNVYVLGTFVPPSNNVVIQQNLPTSGNGNLNALVIRQPPLTPLVGGIQLNGDNSSITLTGTNGAAGANYCLLMTTNLALPLSNWTVLSTNQFGPGGSFSVTASPNPNSPRAFYRLRVP